MHNVHKKDVQARSTCKHGRTWDGYPLHRRADRRWGLIRRHSVSAAHVHASQQFEALWDPSNTGRSVWADRASANRQRDADLEQHRDRPWIVEKAKPAKPLRSATQRRNRRLARERASVEHVFARLAHCGGKWVRGIGLERANVVIG